MSGELRVTFTGDDEPAAFTGGVGFRIMENGVLVLSDGDEVRRIAPHAWREVRGGGQGLQHGDVVFWP